MKYFNNNQIKLKFVTDKYPYKIRFRWNFGTFLFVTSLDNRFSDPIIHYRYIQLSLPFKNTRSIVYFLISSTDFSHGLKHVKNSTLCRLYLSRNTIFIFFPLPTYLYYLIDKYLRTPWVFRE